MPKADNVHIRLRNRGELVILFLHQSGLCFIQSPGAMWTIRTLVATQNLAQKEPHITGHAWLVKIEVHLFLTLPILTPFDHFTVKY